MLRRIPLNVIRQPAPAFARCFSGDSHDDFKPQRKAVDLSDAAAVQVRRPYDDVGLVTLSLGTVASLLLDRSSVCECSIGLANQLV